jgi:hypothetical protein
VTHGIGRGASQIGVAHAFVGIGRGENDECTALVVAALRAIIPMK